MAEVNEVESYTYILDTSSFPASADPGSVWLPYLRREWDSNP